jgi:hypothetical protein
VELSLAVQVVSFVQQGNTNRRVANQTAPFVMKEMVPSGKGPTQPGQHVTVRVLFYLDI